MQALNALATTDGERSVNLLRQALRDDADLEEGAALGPAAASGDWARRPLERAVRDRDPSIRTAAEQALEAWPESPD